MVDREDNKENFREDYREEEREDSIIYFYHSVMSQMSQFKTEIIDNISDTTRKFKDSVDYVFEDALNGGYILHTPPPKWNTPNTTFPLKKPTPKETIASLRKQMSEILKKAEEASSLNNTLMKQYAELDERCDKLLFPPLPSDVAVNTPHHPIPVVVPAVQTVGVIFPKS
jgi:hypothetical protein